MEPFSKHITWQPEGNIHERRLIETTPALCASERVCGTPRWTGQRGWPVHLHPSPATGPHVKNKKTKFRHRQREAAMGFEVSSRSCLARVTSGRCPLISDGWCGSFARAEQSRYQGQLPQSFPFCKGTLKGCWFRGSPSRLTLSVTVTVWKQRKMKGKAHFGMRDKAWWAEKEGGVAMRKSSVILSMCLRLSEKLHRTW